jgi:hypothetical protein
MIAQGEQRNCTGDGGDENITTSMQGRTSEAAIRL